MTGRVSISDILRTGFEATKKNLSTVVALFIGLHALIFILAHVLNAQFLNILMIPVVLLMQIAIYKSFKQPIIKFDINQILELKDPNLKDNLWKLFITYLIYVVLIALMAITIIGIPVAIFFLIYWYVFPYIVLDHKISGWDALKRSREMIKGNWWRTFVLFLITAILGIISTSVINSITGTNTFMAGLLISIVSGLISIYFGYVAVSYYFSLKK